MYKKYLAIIFAVALTFSVTSGCGLSESSSEAEYVDNGYDASTELAAGESLVGKSGSSYDDDGGNYSADEEYIDDYSSGEDGAGTGAAANYEQKLIKTYNLSVETTDLSGSVELVRQKVSEYGGYVQSSDVSQSSSYADFTLRIPKDKADAFLNDTDGFGTLTQESENQEDITMSYYDTKAHVEALEKQHERLLELMDGAEDVDTIVALEERLSEVEYELSSYEQSLKIYDNQVEYVTVCLYLNEVSIISEQEEDSFFTRISKGLESNMEALGEGFVNLLVFLITGIPFFIVIAIIFGVVIFIMKKSAKRSGKKAKKDEAEGSSYNALPEEKSVK